jgi:hypothetical protein
VDSGVLPWDVALLFRGIRRLGEATEGVGLWVKVLKARK